MLAYTSDHHTLPLPTGHRFPISKYTLLREQVQRDLPWVRLQPAMAADEPTLRLAHEQRYIQAVLEGGLSPAAQREIGFPWSERMAERSCRSVGATIGAARTALGEGVATNLAGGTHHASADKGSGFCVFNDVAVAARLMQAEWHGHHPQATPLQILVIDLDVHQGNGTAEIFAGDASVFTFSMHGERNFPFRKHPGDLDVGLPDGCTDQPYLDALDTALAQIWRQFGPTMPGLAFYLAGADPLADDRLGRLALTPAGLAERDRRVLTALRERHVPVALSMAGGYGHDIHATVAAQCHTVALAHNSWQAWQDRAASDSLLPGSP